MEEKHAKVNAWLASCLAPEEDIEEDGGVGGDGERENLLFPRADLDTLGAGTTFRPPPIGIPPLELPPAVALSSSSWTTREYPPHHQLHPGGPGGEDGPSGDWVLHALEAECSGFMLRSVLAPPLALCAVERAGLKQRRDEMVRAMMRTSLASVLYTSTPLSGALTKRTFQLLLLGFLPWYLLQSAYYSRPHPGQPSLFSPSLRTKAVRFVPLAARDGTRAPDLADPGILSFGLASYAVPLAPRFTKGSSLSVVNASEMLLTFPSEVSFNGWWLVTSDRDPARDAVSFEVLAMLGCGGECGGEGEGGGDEWVRVGASGWFRSGFGSSDLFGTAATWRVPVTRGDRVVFDYSFTWVEWANLWGIELVGIVATVLAVSAATRDRISLSVRYFSVTPLMWAFWFITTAANLFAERLYVLAVFRVVPGLTWAVFMPNIEAWQSWFMPTLGAMCGVSLVGGTLEVFAYGYRDPSEFARYAVMTSSFFSFLAYTRVLRGRILRQALDIVRQDKAAYDAEWERVLARSSESGERSTASLDAIRRLADKAGAGADPLLARQLHRMRSGHGSLAPAGWGLGLAPSSLQPWRLLSGKPWPRSAGSVVPLVAQEPLKKRYGPRLASPRNLVGPSPLSLKAATTVAASATSTPHFGAAAGLRPQVQPQYVASSPAPPAGVSDRALDMPLAISGVSRQTGQPDVESDPVLVVDIPREGSQDQRPRVHNVVPRVASDASRRTIELCSSGDALLVEAGTGSGSAEGVSAGALGEQGLEQGPYQVVMGPKYFRFDSFFGSVDPGRPVCSLDQIYLQAAALSPFFRAHVLRLASRCDALLKFRRPAKGAGGLGEGGWQTTYESWRNVGVVTPASDAAAGGSVAFSSSLSLGLKHRGPQEGGASDTGQEQAQHDERGTGGVIWAPLKSVLRSTEKVLRNYRGDASRLMDVCRETLTFETPEGIAACLQEILDDPDYVVVQVKNRMSPGSDSWHTAGYRSVLVNLRIVTDSTTYFGLDTHVAELQLVLLSFMKIKSTKGHGRYIQYRDVRGE